MVQGQSRQKLHKTPSPSTDGHGSTQLSSQPMLRLGSRKSLFQASLGKKMFARPHLNGKSWTWWCTYVTPAIAGSLK
jgi:hypothetical protein